VIKKVFFPIITCNPWNPVAINKVDPYPESGILTGIQTQFLNIILHITYLFQACCSSVLDPQ